jgi:hypothetical protein
MTVAPAKDFVSIGALASHLRVTVRTIEQEAQRLNLAPACRINYVVHFDGEQVERLTEQLQKGST